MTELCVDLIGYKKEYLNMSDMDTCLIKGLDKIIDQIRLSKDWTACYTIYYMLSDMAAEDPDRNYLIQPRFSLATTRVTSNEVERKMFNRLYEKYITRPCMMIVEEPETKTTESSELPEFYSRLAHSACKILILDSKKLQVLRKGLPKVMAHENHLIHLGNIPFRYRLPEKNDQYGYL